MIDHPPADDPSLDDQVHCIARIRDLVARNEPTPRALVQIGYNLGRLSELTGRGRGPFWDRWKDALIDWNGDRLAELAQGLHPEPRITSSPPRPTRD